LRTLVVQVVDYSVMSVFFSIQLAFAHQGPQSIWTFCSLMDGLLILEVRIGMQSVVLLYCHECAKYHRAHMTGWPAAQSDDVRANCQQGSQNQNSKYPFGIQILMLGH